MSTIIMSQCWPLQGMTPAQKAVLISIADNANDDGVGWPSVPYIAMRTCLSERSVQNAIKWLISAGILSAQERIGRSTVYTVTPAAFAPPQELRGANNDTAPANNDGTPAAFAPTPAATAPRTIKNHQGTVKEPSIAPVPEVKPISQSRLVALGVDAQVAAEFLALRRRKRAALTPLALHGIQREAGKAGVDLDFALRKCVERGWQSIEASWITRDNPTGVGGRPMPNRQEALEARNREVAERLARTL